MYPEMISQIQN